MRVALGALLAAVALAACGGSAPATPPGLLDGIPQEGVVLGEAGAPVTVVEFADLQCPYCARFARSSLPVVVRELVRPGKVRLVFRGVVFLGPDSERGLRAVLAAGEQGKAWQLLELLYRHQGAENSGWLTDALLQRLGAQVDGLDVERMLAERASDAVERELAIAAQAAADARVDATPTFWGGPTGQPLSFVGRGAATAAALRSVVDLFLSQAAEGTA